MLSRLSYQATKQREMATFINLIRYEDTDDQEDENTHTNNDSIYYMVEEPAPVETDEVENMAAMATISNNSHPNVRSNTNETRQAETAEENINWSRTTTLFLINEYMERVNRFRDPKIKKKTLWNEIKEIFIQKGYYITCSALDRKWRNLKKTYTTIKDNTRKTGRGRMTWEYFDQFEEIYIQDRTMNMPNTISSLATDIHNNNACSSENTSCVSLPRPSPTLPDTSNDMFCVSSASPSQTVSSHLVMKENSNKDKSIRNRALYNFRKKQLEIEESRVNEIKLLRQAVENNNAIQQQRNDILRAFVEHGTTNNKNE